VVHTAQYTPREGIYTRDVHLPTHAGRHIPGLYTSLHTPREAYTSPSHLQTGIYRKKGLFCAEALSLLRREGEIPLRREALSLLKMRGFLCAERL